MAALALGADGINMGSRFMCIVESCIHQNVKEAIVAGVRGRRVFDEGDVDAGIWTVGTAMGLINDIPTVGDLVARIVGEAESLINDRLAGMVTESAARIGV